MDDRTPRQDFRSGPGDWPTEAPDGEIDTEDGYRLTGDEVVVVAPWEVSASTRRFVEAEVTLGRGRAGVFCLGGDDGATGYRLTISDQQQLRLERHGSQGTSTLAEEDVPDRVASEPGKPTLLRLVCARTEDGVAIGLTVNASPWQRITDPRPIQPTTEQRIGLVVQGSATFHGVALRDADS